MAGTPGRGRHLTMALARIATLSLLGLGGWVGTSAVAATPALACSIAPGTTTCVPDVLTVSPSATLVSSHTETVNNGSLNWTYTERVYRDPTNIYCGTCLTWVVKVTANATDRAGIQRVTVSDFSSYLTDIGTVSGSAPGITNDGTRAPNNVGRDGTGSVLSWDFTTNPIGAGQKSVLLEIETNSTAVKPGTISVQDGVAGSSENAFGPIPEVPFVPALALLGGVAIGGVLWRRRRQEANGQAIS